MSRKSYIASDRDGGRLYLLGRGTAAAPEGAIDRHQAAVLLSCEDDQVEAEVMSLRTVLGTDCRTAGAGDGLLLHGGDVRALANAKLRGEHRRRQSPRRERFQFSDPGRRPERHPASNLNPGSLSSTRTVRVSASKISAAAKRFGLAEQELTERLIGRAKMQIVDGELLIRNADLSRMVSEGTLPDPAQTKQVDQAIAEIEGRKAADPAVEARTQGIADALGVDLGTGTKPKSGSGGTVRVKADQESRRLGRPRRWSERTW
jgi:hypothetical protein